MLVALVTVAAFAQTQPTESAEPSAEPSAPVAAPAPSGDDGKQLSVGARWRYLWMPRGALNPWWYPTGESRLPRPDLNGQVIGVEFGMDAQPATFTLWGEGWIVNFGEGYYDDVDSPDDYSDGDWITPQGIGMIAVGGNFGHEWAVSPQDKPAWVGFALSGGLGLGVTWGHFDQWQPGWSVEPPTLCQPMSGADIRKDVCPPDKQPKPPAVLPVLDLTIAWRVHLAERAIVRLEGGFHDMPYVGLAAGGVL